MTTRDEFLRIIEKIYEVERGIDFYEDEDGSIVLIGSDLSEISFQFDENGNLCWFE